MYLADSFKALEMRIKKLEERMVFAHAAHSGLERRVKRLEVE